MKTFFILTFLYRRLELKMIFSLEVFMQKGRYNTKQRDELLFEIY